MLSTDPGATRGGRACMRSNRLPCILGKAAQRCWRCCGPACARQAAARGQPPRPCPTPAAQASSPGKQAAASPTLFSALFQGTTQPRWVHTAFRPYFSISPFSVTIR